MRFIPLFAGFLLLSFSIFALNNPTITAFDHASVEWMALHRHEIFNRICIALSVMGGMPFVLLLSTLWCIFLLWYKKNTSALFICIGILGGICLAWFSKLLTGRPRPDDFFHLVQSYGSSFPSAHSVYAASLGCLAIYLCAHHPKRHIITGLAIFWMLSMGLSRVYLGVHFPSDVIAGWSISFIWISLLYVMFSRIAWRTNKKFR